MKFGRTIRALRSSVIALIIPLTACSGPAPKAMIPDPSDTRAVSIIFLDFDARGFARCVVEDERTIRELYDCVTPNKHSEVAAKSVRSGPIIGKLGFQGPSGTTWVEFRDSGMDALCFLVRGEGYLRGGANYRNYRSDHKRLYGIDSEVIDEGYTLHQKLRALCKR